MLDQRLIRENPSFVEDKLSTRGKVFNISHIHELTIKIKQIDIELCNLQSESKKISKLIGNKIRNSGNENNEELEELKNKGNEYKIKISEYEERKRTSYKKLKYELLRLPNLPSGEAPLGNDEYDNQQIREWGDPIKNNNLKTHWEIGENLGLFDFSKTTKIAKSRFITLKGNGAKLERALINFMLDVHIKN